MGGDELYTQFDSVFFEKTRLSIMTLLYQEGSVTFTRFKNLLRATDGGLYTHARKLIDAGYVKTKKHLDGERAQTVYTFTPAGRRLFERYLGFLEHLVNKRNIQE